MKTHMKYSTCWELKVGGMTYFLGEVVLQLGIKPKAWHSEHQSLAVTPPGIPQLLRRDISYFKTWIMYSSYLKKERRTHGVKDPESMSGVPWVIQLKNKWELKPLVPSLWHFRRSLQCYDIETNKKICFHPTQIDSHLVELSLQNYGYCKWVEWPLISEPDWWFGLKSLF